MFFSPFCGTAQKHCEKICNRLIRILMFSDAKLSILFNSSKRFANYFYTFCLCCDVLLG